MNKILRNTKSRILISLGVFLLVYNLLIVILVHVERISPQSNLSDYPNAYWYSLVTLTTVGYGDLFPSTLHGRIVGSVFVILSLLFYAILVGNISSLVGTIRENRKLGYNGTNFKNHTVIIGWNRFAALVCDQLIEVSNKVAVVSLSRNDIDFIRDRYNPQEVFAVFAHSLKNIDILEKVNIQYSSIVFVNLEEDTEKLVFIINSKKEYPNLEFVVTLSNPSLKETFLSAGARNTITEIEISSKLLSSYIYEPDVAAFSESLMTLARADSDYDIKQLLVTDGNPYVTKTYQEIFYDLKRRYNGILIGITKRDKFGKRILLKNPFTEIRISVDDYLIIILNGKSFKMLREVFQVEEGAAGEKKEIDPT